MVQVEQQIFHKLLLEYTGKIRTLKKMQYFSALDNKKYQERKRNAC